MCDVTALKNVRTSACCLYFNVVCVKKCTTEDDYLRAAKIALLS